MILPWAHRSFSLSFTFWSLGQHFISALSRLESGPWQKKPSRCATVENIWRFLTGSHDLGYVRIVTKYLPGNSRCTGNNKLTFENSLHQHHRHRSQSTEYLATRQRSPSDPTTRRRPHCYKVPARKKTRCTTNNKPWHEDNMEHSLKAHYVACRGNGTPQSVTQETMKTMSTHEHLSILAFSAFILGCWAFFGLLGFLLLLHVLTYCCYRRGATFEQNWSGIWPEKLRAVKMPTSMKPTMSPTESRTCPGRKKHTSLKAHYMATTRDRTEQRW